MRKPEGEQPEERVEQSKADFPRVRAALAKAAVTRTMPANEERKRVRDFATIDYVRAIATELLPATIGGKWEPAVTATTSLPPPLSVDEWKRLCGYVVLFKRADSNSRSLTLRTGCVVGQPWVYDLHENDWLRLTVKLAAYGSWAWYRNDLSIRAPGMTGLLIVTRGLGSADIGKAGFQAVATP